VRAAHIYGCALLLAWSVNGQIIKARDIKLVEGRGDLLQFHNDVTKVAIAEPKIADAIVISPREIMVNAKTPGGTTLMVWETDTCLLYTSRCV